MTIFKTSSQLARDRYNRALALEVAARPQHAEGNARDVDGALTSHAGSSSWALMKASSHSGRGFTLIELLVTFGIIALLASLLLSTLSRAKEQARRMKCVSNLKQ